MLQELPHEDATEVAGGTGSGRRVAGRRGGRAHGRQSSVEFLHRRSPSTNSRSLTLFASVAPAALMPRKQ